MGLANRSAKRHIGSRRQKQSASSFFDFFSTRKRQGTLKQNAENQDIHTQLRETLHTRSGARCPHHSCTIRASITTQRQRKNSVAVLLFQFVPQEEPIDQHSYPTEK